MAMAVLRESSAHDCAGPPRTQPPILVDTGHRGDHRSSLARRGAPGHLVSAGRGANLDEALVDFREFDERPQWRGQVAQSGRDRGFVGFFVDRAVLDGEQPGQKRKSCSSLLHKSPGSTTAWSWTK